MRTYPNGSLAGHVLGLVLYNQKGFYGVAGDYDDILGGDTVRTFKSIIPLDVGTELRTETIADVYLTGDREVQFLAEQVLADGIHEFEKSVEMFDDPNFNLKQIVTHVYGLDEIQKGFETAYDKTTGSVKVQIHQD